LLYKEYTYSSISREMFVLAFEPLTLAIGATLMEQIIKRPSRVCCYTKLWLRRAPDVLFENAVNEVADPALDFLNGVHGVSAGNFIISSVITLVLVAFIFRRNNIA